MIGFAFLKRNAADIGALAVLLVVGTWWGQWYVERLVAGGVRPDFYQNEFGPAVMAACGRGFQNVTAERIPALNAFLTTTRADFDCTLLPADVPVNPLNGRQQTWRYLVWSVAVTWMVVGSVSWPAVYWLSGLLFALTAVAAYGGARLFAPPLLAFLAGAAVETSPLHLRHTLHVRDYSKAPFMVALGVLLAALLYYRERPGRQAAVAGLFGALLGVGMGFRNDLIIAIPAFAITSVFIAVRAAPRRRLRTVGATTAACAAGFLLCSAPLWSAYSTGGGASMAHVALLGFAPQFDGELSVERSPLYSLPITYNDSVMAGVISGEVSRVLGYDGPVAPYDGNYDRASNGLAAAIIRQTPGDIWLRGLASTVAIVSLPSSSYDDTEPPPLISGPGLLSRAFTMRANWFRARKHYVLATVVAAVVIGAVIDPVATCALALLTIFFAGYPATQFHPRHYFHLNVIPIIAGVFVVAWVVRAVQAVLKGQRLVSAGPLQSFRNVALVFAILGSLVWLPLPVLRAVQHRSLTGLFQQYLDAPRVPLAVEVIERDNIVALIPSGLPEAERAAHLVNSMRTDYLAVHLTGACAVEQLTMSVDYAPGPEAGFARIVKVPRPQSGETLMFVSVFASRVTVHGPSAWIRFAGLSVPAEQRACIGAIERVADPKPFPVLFDAVLPQDWRTMRMHQVLVPRP